MNKQQAKAIADHYVESVANVLYSHGEPYARHVQVRWSERGDGRWVRITDVSGDWCGYYEPLGLGRLALRGVSHGIPPGVIILPCGARGEIEKQFGVKYRGLYELLTELGAVIHNHESDLYTPATPDAQRLAREGGYAYGVFENQVEGGPWLDVPFAYIPWWEAKCSS